MKKKLRKRAAPFGGPTNEPMGNPSPPPGNADPGGSPIDPPLDPEVPEEEPLAPMDESVEEVGDDMLLDEPMPRMPEPTPTVPPEININAETGESSIAFPGVNINITSGKQASPYQRDRVSPGGGAEHYFQNKGNELEQQGVPQSGGSPHGYSDPQTLFQDINAWYKQMQQTNPEFAQDFIAKGWGDIYTRGAETGQITQQEFDSLASAFGEYQRDSQGINQASKQANSNLWNPDSVIEEDRRLEEAKHRGAQDAQNGNPPAEDDGTLWSKYYLEGYESASGKSDDWRSISRDNFESLKDTPTEMANNWRSMQDDFRDQWDFTKNVIKDDVDKIKNVFRGKRADVNDGTDSDYSNFMKGNVPDVEDPDPLSKDTHEYVMNNPKNRRVPKTFDVKINTNEKYEDAEVLAESLEFSLNAAVEHSEGSDSVVVKNIENPAALIEELKRDGIDAELDSGNLNDIYEGMKVSFVGDLPEIGHYYDPFINIRARVTAIEGNDYYLYNDKFGHFVADLEEINV